MIRSTMLVLLPLVSFIAHGVAAAVNRRDISCTAVQQGYVGLFSLDQATAPLPPSGLDVYLKSITAAESFLTTNQTNEMPPPLFQFFACDSDFMGYETITDGTATIYYGHFVPTASDSYNCLLSGDNLIYGNSVCVFADGTVQQEEYWVKLFQVLSP